jgi:hypothetical protein
MLAPQCDLPVIWVPGHPMGGQATHHGFGRPLILVDPIIQNVAGPGFVRFVIAHECAHHVRGHLFSLQQIGQHGPYARLALNPAIELDADCWAESVLAHQGDVAAVQAAASLFAWTQGSFAQPGYPSGQARANTIRRCGGLP